MIDTKRKEFSFEIKEEKTEYTEILELGVMIENTVENYRFYKNLGKHEEANQIKAKLQEIKFAHAHLILVMNMDFDKPTENLKNMAQTSKIDLKDPRIIDEFKAIQQANLEDIRRMKEGKPLLT